MPKFRHQYSPAVRVKQGPFEETLTKQSMQHECDINVILDRYQRTQIIDHYSKHAPKYGVYDPIDFKQAMDVITESNRMFMDLPSSMRNRFHNDPAEFLEFVQDENNAEEMRELGMYRVREPQDPAPDPAPVQEPSPEPPAQ